MLHFSSKLNDTLQYDYATLHQSHDMLVNFWVVSTFVYHVYYYSVQLCADVCLNTYFLFSCGHGVFISVNSASMDATNYGF